jgi:hypothetical protein
MTSLALLLLEGAAWAACPCYSLSSTANTHNCGVEAIAGSNPTVAAWQPIFALVGGGPAAWGTSGPSVAAITAGCSQPTAPHDVPPVFPCELLKAIAMNESGWTQFCVPTTPADEAHPPERTMISFDCGYGIAQVTSGMHIGETPSFDRTKVADDPTYNLATGAEILAGKWRAVKCVGDRQPSTIEDWYTAVWAYNGLAASNNPSNPNYSATRPVCDPNVGCPNRPYQERVFGWVEHPPRPSYWTPVALAYPNPGDIPYMSGVQSPPALPEPNCAGPTDCTNHRATHVTTCSSAPPSDGGAPPDMWTPKDLATARSDGSIGSDGSDGGAGHAPGGCDCDLGASGPSAGALLFALVAAVALRRASKHA